MILTCPECATRYLLSDADRIGSVGRTVRCSKCQTSWFVSSDLDELTLKDNEHAEILAQVQSAPKVEDPNLDRRKSSHSDFKSGGVSGRVEDKPLDTRPENTDHNTRFDTPYSPGAHVGVRDRQDRRRRNFRLTIIGLIWGITLGLLALAATLAYLSRQDVIDKYPKAATLYRAFGIDVSAQGLAFDKPVTRSVFIDGSPVLVINGSVKNITTRTMSLPMVALSLHNTALEPLAEWRVEFANTELAKGKRSEFIAHFPNPPIDAVHLRYRFDDGMSDSFAVNPAPIKEQSPEGQNLYQDNSVPIPTPAISKEDAISRREVESIPMIVDE